MTGTPDAADAADAADPADAADTPNLTYEWDPPPLAEVVALFRGFPAPWWVSGGYALELAVGHRYRDHGDIDISVLRRDHQAVRAYLAAWDCHAADPPGHLRPWAIPEALPTHVHDIWVREHGGSRWRFQLMLDEAEDGTWIYRRDHRIRRPLVEVFDAHRDPPRIAPEVQLLYKSRGLRPKDELDFATVLPRLTSAQRRWLATTLASEHGDHPWLPLLA